MAPPNSGTCFTELNPNTDSSLGSSYLPEVLKHSTSDSPQFAAEMGSPKKRKSEIQNKSVKRKSKKDIQKEIIQMEIEEVNALEKENKALEEEEVTLKKRLQEMRSVYMDFIKNGQIVFVDKPTSTSPIASASLPMANFSQTPVQYRTVGQITPGFATPPSTSQDVVFDSMSANPSIYGHNVGHSKDPSSPPVQCLQLPVIQCTSDFVSPQQWPAPLTPESDVSISPQPDPFLAMEPVSNDLPSVSTGWQQAIVTVENIDLDSINACVILPLEDITQN